jgi:hypothetical protein
MEAFATALWPEQPVALPGKSTPHPPPRTRIITADSPTEVSSAATTPLPVARGGPVPSKKRSRVGIGLGVLVLGGAGAGVYVAWSGSEAGAGPPAAVSAPAGRPVPNVIQVAPNDVTLQVGERSGLSATVFDQEGRLMAGAKVRWASSDERVARVDDDGRVTALSSGVAVVTVGSGDREAEARVDVRAPRGGRGGDRPGFRPPAPPPPVQGFLTINTEPPSTVFVDGREVGQTPVVEFDVSPGPHTVRVERPGFRTVTERVTVTAGQTVRKRWVLQEGSD